MLVTDCKVEETDSFGAGRVARMPATIVRCNCQLGEAPAWDGERARLLWVDIRKETVFSFSLSDRVLDSWFVPGQPSAVIPKDDGRYLIPCGRVVRELDPRDGSIGDYTTLPELADGYRTNEAKCGPNGTLWLTTMDDREQDRGGQLIEVAADGKARIRATGIGIPNTLAWDTARHRFYFGDSLTGEIAVYEWTRNSLVARSLRQFLGADAAPGVPDGSAIDVDGYLWNARYGGSCVIRVAPDGTIDRTIELPVERPTSCAFGNDDLKTLFITSASSSVADTGRGNGLDGAVFAFDADVAGQAVPLFSSAPEPAAASRAS